MENNKPLSDEAKEARRAYKREWNRKNPGKQKAYQQAYWERKAAQASGKVVNMCG